jgi:hypothetical protein
LDGELVPAKALQGKFRAPPVIDQVRHANLAPLRLVGRPPEEGRRQGIVTVAEDIGLHANHVADDALDRELAPIHRRRDVLDHEPRRGGRLLHGRNGHGSRDRLQGTALQNPDLQIGRAHV